MATKAFFISETYLKDNSPLSGNVDIQEIYPYARTAENIYIQEAIGTSLYDDLVAKVIASKASPPVAISANDITLIKKIRDAVLWYTVYDALPFLAIKLRNIGVVKQTGEGHESAARDDVSYLRKECKNKGDFYLKRVQDYLCENEDLYPAYDQGEDDDLDPNTNSPTGNCDIAFDKNSDDDIDTDFVRKWIG